MPFSTTDVALQQYHDGRFRSLRHAPGHHGIAKTSLTSRWHGKKSMKDWAECRTKLTRGEENSLAAYVERQTKAGYPISMPIMRRLANEQLDIRAIKDDIAVPEKVGVNWHNGFRGRFPNIEIERTKVMERMWVTGASRTVLEDYLDLFKEMICSMIAENVYNMDETGVQLGVDKVEACVVDKTVLNRVRKSPQDRESATVIECISATGCPLTPFVILGAKTHRSQWYPEHGEGPAKWKYATSPNGYTDNQLSLEWLERVFHPETVERAAGNWRLLIMDGHGSHETADFMTFCFMHRIYLLRLPPHTSHLTQPLDVGCFAPLKHYYREGVREATREGATKITTRIFMDLYRGARDLAFTEGNIKGAWRGAGLFPFDKNRVLLRANPRSSTPPAQIRPSDGLSECPTTPHSTNGVRSLQNQVIAALPHLCPATRIGVQKLGVAAQMAMGENIILRYDNRVLRYCLQQKDSHKSQRAFLVSRARVVTEKDIMDARHAKNNVRVLAIECPGPASEDTTTAEAPAEPLITTFDFSNSLITFEDEENVIFEVGDDDFDRIVHGLPNLV
jgi:hypothetical protein